MVKKVPQMPGKNLSKGFTWLTLLSLHPGQLFHNKISTVSPIACHKQLTGLAAGELWPLIFKLER
jgi:hypothetical protein